MKCVKCDAPDVTLHLTVCESSDDAKAGYRGGSFCNEQCLAAYIEKNPGEINAVHGIKP